MDIYVVYARDKKTGVMEKFSPIGINKDREAMVELAVHIKCDMSDTFDKVTLRQDHYEFVNTVFVEV